jgi:hypothetical protein
VHTPVVRLQHPPKGHVAKPHAEPYPFHTAPHSLSLTLVHAPVAATQHAPVHGFEVQVLVPPTITAPGHGFAPAVTIAHAPEASQHTSAYARIGCITTIAPTHTVITRSVVAMNSERRMRRPFYQARARLHRLPHPEHAATSLYSPPRSPKFHLSN